MSGEIAVDEAVTGEVICAATAARCICVLPPGHQPADHECREGCGGKWRGSFGSGDFEVIAFPLMDAP